MEIKEDLNKNIQDNLKYILSVVEKNLKKEQIDLIVKDYKKIESIISELELCLADLDDEFQLEGISFALFNIGKILVNKEEQL